MGLKEEWGLDLHAGQRNNRQDWVRGRFSGLGRIRCSRVGRVRASTQLALREQNWCLREFEIKGKGGVLLLQDFATVPLGVVQTCGVSIFPCLLWFCCLKYVSPSLTILWKSKEEWKTNYGLPLCRGPLCHYNVKGEALFYCIWETSFMMVLPACITTWLLRWLHTKLLCQNIQEVKNLSLDDSKVSKFCLDTLYCKYFPFFMDLGKLVCLRLKHLLYFFFFPSSWL